MVNEPQFMARICDKYKVFYCISQLECYVRIINVFVLDYEMPADRAVFLCIYKEL